MVLMVLAGAAGLGLAYEGWRAASAQQSAVQAPPASPGPAAPSTSAPPSHRAAGGLVLPASVPVRLDIPAIGVSTPLMRLGLNADRTVQVPPIQKDSPAGWYQYSPTPGQLGPSVILGHVTVGQFGNGVFLRLAALRAGDQVEVFRSDGTEAVFQVQKVAEYPKSSFPTREVYGGIAYAGLRLITCGGSRNELTHTYPDNVVAYASLVSAKASAA